MTICSKCDRQMELKEEEEKYVCPYCGHSFSTRITKEEITEKLFRLKKEARKIGPQFDPF